MGHRPPPPRLIAALFACLVLLGAGSPMVLAAPAEVTYEALDTFDVTSPCTGERLSVSGTVRLVSRFDTTPSGEMHLVIVESATDWTVVDTLGNTYLSTGQPGQFIINGASSTDSFSFTLVNRQWFVTPGDEGNMMVRRVRHIQVTPDGTVTAFHDFVSTECRG